MEKEVKAVGRKAPIVKTNSKLKEYLRKPGWLAYADSYNACSGNYSWNNGLSCCLHSYKRCSIY